MGWPWPECLEWVPKTGGEYPKNAIQAGVDSGKKLYVARASHEGMGICIPGKLHVSHSSVYIPYDGKELAIEEYEVLCGPPACLSWIDSSDGNIPSNAVPGGHDSSGEILYIGRVIHNGTVTVGKVHPSHKCCYVPYGGDELRFSEYEILVKNKLGQLLNV